MIYTNHFINVSWKKIEEALETCPFYSNSSFAEYSSAQQKLEVTYGWTAKMYYLNVNQP